VTRPAERGHVQTFEDSHLTPPKVVIAHRTYGRRLVG
jgi:hypothetical protein